MKRGLVGNRSVKRLNSAILSLPLLALLDARCFAHVSLSKGVPVVKDDDQDSTDLMKCLRSLQEKERADGVDVRRTVHCTRVSANGRFNDLSLSLLMAL